MPVVRVSYRAARCVIEPEHDCCEGRMALRHIRSEPRAIVVADMIGVQGVGGGRSRRGGQDGRNYQCLIGHSVVEGLVGRSEI